jgi:hypothetical protein
VLRQKCEVLKAILRPFEVEKYAEYEIEEQMTFVRQVK